MVWLFVPVIAGIVMGFWSPRARRRALIAAAGGSLLGAIALAVAALGAIEAEDVGDMRALGVAAAGAGVVMIAIFLTLGGLTTFLRSLVGASEPRDTTAPRADRSSPRRVVAWIASVYATGVAVAVSFSMGFTPSVSAVLVPAATVAIVAAVVVYAWTRAASIAS